MSWRDITLGALCAEGGGGVQTGPFGSQLHAADYVREGVPSVMPHNIGDNVIDERGIARITVKDATRLGKYLLAEGDIVYSRRGDVEKRALVRPENEGWLCGTGCLRVRLGDQGRNDARFISQLLGTPKTREWISRHAVGATMPNLNTKILSSVPLRVPELEEQRAIADVLAALEDKIAANTRLTETASELAEGLTREGVDPGRKMALTQIADVVMGSSPVGASLNEDGRGTVFYQGVRDFGFRSPKRRIWTEKITRLGEAGDTLLSVRAPVGRLNVASEPICIGRGLAAIRTAVGAPATLFNLLKAFPEVWEPFEAEGTIFGSINRGQLEGLQVPSVKPELAAGLESRLAGLEASITSALAENNLLAELRDTLLPELMSGRLCVKDAEKKIEEVV
jgi:type I restriction enzyme S subunit